MSIDNTERRLIDALQAATSVEPSDDLWSRVVHSIEEDRAHRRRVVSAAFVGVVAFVGLVVLMLLGLTDGRLGRQVRLPVMEAVDTIALAAIVVLLGRAVARFGRGYATDLWPQAPAMATALVRLLDVAYALVFGGYILLTAELDFGASSVVVAEQIQSLGYRIGGLLVTMGVLHGLTIMVLPIVALISNSTRTGHKLPRWLVTGLVVVGIPVGFVLFMMTIGLVMGGGG